MSDRAKFYSIQDLANGSQLKRAEVVLQSFNPNAAFSLADAIELYNIRLLLDNGLMLKTWSEQMVLNFKNTAKTFGRNIVATLKTLDKSLSAEDSNSIANQFKKLPWEYQEDFWPVLEAYGQIETVDESVLSAILDDSPNELESILHCKKVTARFDAFIADFMRRHPEISTSILLQTYLLETNSPNPKPLFIPDSLSIADREKILSDYIALPQAHPNSLKLIETFKDDPRALTASAKTRLAAKRRAAERQNEIFSQNPNSLFSMEFEFSFGPTANGKPLDAGIDGTKMWMKVDDSFLDKLGDYELLNVFRNLGLLNPHDFIAPVFDPHKGNILERITTQSGKTEYPINEMFNFENGMALIIVKGIENYMLQKGRGSLEGLIKRFYESELLTRFGYKGVAISLPEPTDHVLNKCKAIAPELESLMKQYNLLCVEGKIDSDLFALGYGMHLTDAQTLVSHKYAFIPSVDTAETLRRILHLLFSDQSPLAVGSKWSDPNHQLCFANRISDSKRIRHEELEEFHMPYIDFLVSEGILNKHPDGSYTATDNEQLAVLNMLYQRPEISYWHQEPQKRAAIDTMVSKGWLAIDEDHLLSPMERDYVDYWLNDHKYSNGHSLRNRYLHGVGAPASTQQQNEDYYRMLTIMIMLLLKVDSDLRLHQFLTNRHTPIN